MAGLTSEISAGPDPVLDLHRHLRAAMVVLGLPALFVVVLSVGRWPGLATTVRLTGLFVVIVAIGTLVADGYDRRYPVSSFGPLSLRLVALVAGLALTIVVAVRARLFFPHISTDIGLALIGLATVTAAGAYRRRCGRALDDRGLAGVLAVVIVVLLQFFVNFALGAQFGWCRYDSEASIFYMIGLSGLFWPGLTEVFLNDRWPRAGLAFSVGRLTIVALVMTGLAAAAAWPFPDGFCNRQEVDPAVVDSARQRWFEADIEDYTMTVSKACYCPYVGELEVTVTDGVVTSIFHYDNPVPVEDYEIVGIGTVERSFDRVDSLSDWPRFSVEFDPVTGVPTRIYADKPHALDSHLTYRVISFTPTP